MQHSRNAGSFLHGRKSRIGDDLAVCSMPQVGGANGVRSEEPRLSRYLLRKEAGFSGRSHSCGLTKPKKKAMLSQNSRSRMCVDYPGVPGMCRSCVSASRANILSKVGYYV